MKKLHKLTTNPIKNTMQVYCGCSRPANCGCGALDPNSYFTSYMGSEQARIFAETHK